MSLVRIKHRTNPNMNLNSKIIGITSNLIVKSTTLTITTTAGDSVTNTIPITKTKTGHRITTPISRISTGLGQEIKEEMEMVVAAAMVGKRKMTTIIKEMVATVTTRMIGHTNNTVVVTGMVVDVITHIDREITN